MSETKEILNEQTKLLRQISQQLDQLIKKEHAGNKYDWTPEGLPICPRHGEAMPRREKQGDVWYSHTVTDPATGEVLYCRGYSSKSSPGWEVGLSEPVRERSEASGEPVKASEPAVSNGNGSAREEFYKLGSEAIKVKTIDPQAFNALADQGNQQGAWENALAELKETLAHK